MEEIHFGGGGRVVRVVAGASSENLCVVGTAGVGDEVGMPDRARFAGRAARNEHGSGGITE